MVGHGELDISPIEQKFALRSEITSLRVRISNKINGGSFGSLHRIKVCDAQKTNCMAKVELSNCPHPQLQQEHNIYSLFDGVDGFGRLVENIGQRLWRISLETTDMKMHDFNILFIERLGVDLLSIYSHMNDIHKVKYEKRLKFGLNSIVNLSEAMFQLMKKLHCMSYIHRDIKPQNFMFGRGRFSTELYVIDFGLAKRYKTNKHMETGVARTCVGTKSYLSSFVRNGEVATRRDDLISVIYLLLKLASGHLLWDTKKKSKKDFPKLTQEEINRKNVRAEIKYKQMSAEVLFRDCKAINDIDELWMILQKLYSMKPTEEPDWDFIERKLSIMRNRYNVPADSYEWFNVDPETNISVYEELIKNSDRII